MPDVQAAGMAPSLVSPVSLSALCESVACVVTHDLSFWSPRSVWREAASEQPDRASALACGGLGAD